MPSEASISCFCRKIGGMERQTRTGEQCWAQWPDVGHDRRDGTFADFKNVDRVGPPRVVVGRACVGSDRAASVGPDHARAESTVTLPYHGVERSNRAAAAKPCTPGGHV